MPSAVNSWVGRVGLHLSGPFMAYTNSKGRTFFTNFSPSENTGLANTAPFCACNLCSCCDWQYEGFVMAIRGHPGPFCTFCLVTWPGHVTHPHLFGMTHQTAWTVLICPVTPSDWQILSLQCPHHWIAGRLQENLSKHKVTQSTYLAHLYTHWTALEINASPLVCGL